MIKSDPLPVEIVLAPQWWFHNEAITFDEDFFYHPAKRVESERKMEHILYDRWGKYGLGADRDKDLPMIGAVHLAAGYLLSEMLGCQVNYNPDTPPQVICANNPDLNISVEQAFQSPACKRFISLVDSLKSNFGYTTGDVNWGGILNIAMDLRGQNIFTDMFDRPDHLSTFLETIAAIIEKFTQDIFTRTGTTSISVNRTLAHIAPPVFLHSECSHTMISVDDYRKFLFDFDKNWSLKYRPFGIHYCGPDPHRYADIFAELPHLDFLDVGFPGNIKEIRAKLPQTFLNIRLSPVEMIEQTPDQIEETIRRLVAESANPQLTGICCINIDEKVTDDKITRIFETVAQLRKQYTN